MRAMDGLCALGHPVQNQRLILEPEWGVGAWQIEKHVKNGLIATQGGSGRRPPDTISALLRRMDAAAAE